MPTMIKNNNPLISQNIINKAVSYQKVGLPFSREFMETENQKKEKY